jgi:hypothetical protein
MEDMDADKCRRGMRGGMSDIKMRTEDATWETQTTEGSEAKNIVVSWRRG